MADQPKDSTKPGWWAGISPLQIVIALLVLLALLIDGYAIVNGLGAPVSDYKSNYSQYTPVGYKTFYQVAAWILFPSYFVVVYFVVRQSWDAFNSAWLRLPETDVLQHCNGGKVKEQEVRNLLAHFNRWRYMLLIPVSLVAGVLCMYMDSERERDTMRLPSAKPTADHVDAYYEKKSTLAGQVARACESPDFMSKWLWEALASAKIDATKICEDNGATKTTPRPSREVQYNNRRDALLKIMKPATQKKASGTGATSGKDAAKHTVKQSNANQLSNDFLSPPDKQWKPVLLMHLEDAILISFGWLIFFQCLAHPVFFWYFERLKVSKNDGGKPLCIRLNGQSEFGEFGLQYWNHALNNLYWYFSLGLFIPIMSRLSQPDLKDLDTSQLVLQFAIPIIVAIPMVATILSRQNRLTTCWESLNDTESKIQKYKKQRLWPLDENWSSKLGVVLAFIILSLSFGFNLASLIG